MRETQLVQPTTWAPIKIWKIWKLSKFWKIQNRFVKPDYISAVADWGGQPGSRAVHSGVGRSSLIPGVADGDKAPPKLVSN